MGELVVDCVLDEGATRPSKKYFENGGWDFYSNEDVVLPAAKLQAKANRIHVGTKMWLYPEDILNAIEFCPAPIVKVHTGTRIAVPKQHVALLRDRSGLSINSYITHVAGVIDVGYTGEIIVGLTNLGKNDYNIKRGDKIIQMIFLETPLHLSFDTEVGKLKETPRGKQGFGESSGR